MTETHTIYFHEAGEPVDDVLTLHDRASGYFSDLAKKVNGTAAVSYVAQGNISYPLLVEVEANTPEYKAPHPSGFYLLAKLTLPLHAVDEIPHQDLENRLGMVRI